MRWALAASAAAWLVGCAAAPEAPAPPALSETVAAASVPLPPRPTTNPALATTPLGQALQAMVRQDPALAAGRAAEQASLADLDQARTALRPSVALQAEAGISTGSRASVTPVLRVSQRLYDGGAARSRIAASEIRVDGARTQSEAVLVTRVAEAIGAWEELHTARVLERLARASVGRHEEIAGRVARRVAAGAGGNAEVLRVDSRRADAEAQLAAAIGRRVEAEAAVLQYFGALPSVGPLPRPPAPRTEAPATAELRALAIARAAAVEDLGAVRAGTRPAVFLDVTGRPGTDGDAALGAALRLDYDLDTSGRGAAAVRSAEAEVARLDAEIALARQDVTRAARTASGREQSLALQLSAAEAAARTAAAALSNAETLFESGRTEIVDLLDLGRDVDLAEARVAELSAALRLARFERLLVSGDILGVFGLCPAVCGG